jgi:hypothetical protein
MRKSHTLLRNVVVCSALGSALLLGCNTKVGTSGTPQAAQKTEVMTPPPAPAPVKNPKGPAASTDTSAATATNTATEQDAGTTPPPSTPSAAATNMAQGGSNGTGSSAPPTIQPGVSNFLDKNIPVPAGANVQLSNMQISDGPVNEIGVSAHFRMQGGVYMSR